MGLGVWVWVWGVGGGWGGWWGESTICQCRNGNTSYFYKPVKCHKCRRNGHGPVPLNNEQRFKFAMSTYTRAAHHCDQRWTCVLMVFRDSHSESNLQQFRLRKLSLRLTRFHRTVKCYVFVHYIENKAKLGDCIAATGLVFLLNKITECNITDTYNSSTAYILCTSSWCVRAAICLEGRLSLLALSSVYSLTVEDGSWSTRIVPAQLSVPL